MWCFNCQREVPDCDSYVEINHDANRGHGDIEFADGENRCDECGELLIEESDWCGGCGEAFAPQTTKPHDREMLCPECLGIALVCEQEHIFRDTITQQLIELLGSDFDSKRMDEIVKMAFSECYAQTKTIIERYRED